MFDIKDKIVLITGAAAGIGASIVRSLLQEDARHITILDIDDKNGFAIQEELNTKHKSSKVKFIKCDVTQEQDLQDAFRTIKNEQGYIDVVINNAGMFDDRVYVKEIGVNITAVVISTIQAWKLMRKDEGGSGGTVVNVASIAALNSSSVMPVYSATKSAVVRFSTLLGDEVHYKRTGIRVLTVCFGVTDTQIIKRENFGSFDKVIEETISKALTSLSQQTPEHAAQGLIDVYKNANSGSVWIVSGGKPAIDVTEKYAQFIKICDDIILS